MVQPPKAPPTGVEIVAPPVHASFEGPVPPSRTLLRDEVYMQIRTAIVQGRLPPGARLRDRDLAENLGVSRMPVREAIRRLQDEGLVVAEASRWTKVAPIDTTLADDLYPIIGALERLAIILGGAWPRKKLNELSAINHQLARTLDEGDSVRAEQADEAFHSLLLRQSQNQRLYSVVSGLKVHLHRVVAVYFGGAYAGSRSVEEHQALIDALAHGDTEGAAHAAEQNWHGPLERLHARLARGDPSRPDGQHNHAS
jgi:DNA-binding GntR family transcriptional regulator